MPFGWIYDHFCIGFFTRKIIRLYPINVPPGCAFYHHIIYFIVATAIFTLYVLISKWYKLRKRDDIVPIHMLAENYSEKNYEQEQRYLEQYNDSDSTWAEVHTITRSETNTTTYISFNSKFIILYNYKQYSWLTAFNLFDRLY